MSESNGKQGKKPSHRVYHVRGGGEGKKGYWTQVGSAWSHDDGKGFNVQLDGLVPLDGKLVLRVPEQKGN